MLKIGSKIRRLRKLRGLTIAEVADGAELTKGYISQLERDIAVPTVTTLKQILDFLGVELSDFFQEFGSRERNIFTVAERTEELKGMAYQLVSLVPKLQYLEMEPHVLIVAANASYSKNFEEDEGFGYVLRGKVEVTVEDETRTIGKGGCFYIFFDNKLSIKNQTDKPSEILLVYY